MVLIWFRSIHPTPFLTASSWLSSLFILCSSAPTVGLLLALWLHPKNTWENDLTVYVGDSVGLRFAFFKIWHHPWEIEKTGIAPGSFFYFWRLQGYVSCVISVFPFWDRYRYPWIILWQNWLPGLSFRCPFYTATKDTLYKGIVLPLHYCHSSNPNISAE